MKLNLENWEASTDKTKSLISRKLKYFHCLSHSLFYGPVQLDKRLIFKNFKTVKYIVLNLMYMLSNTRGGSRAVAISKMECIMRIVNGFQSLAIITKYSILDVATVLDPFLICCILWNLEEYQLLFSAIIFTLYFIIRRIL